MKPIIVIAGTTASGKSDLALQLAKKINGYIINADSRQIYKEFKIATNQPVPNKIKKDGTWIIEGVEHYLYGFVSIKSDYNIFKYQNDVKNLLARKAKDNQYPILVGGTGLYIDSIVYNYQLMETNDVANAKRRDLLSKLSIEDLQKLVTATVPNFNLEQLNESDRNNPRRLMRLIENQSLNQSKGECLNHNYFVLDLDKEVLESHIRSRVDRMLEQGLLEEAKSIYDSYFNTANSPDGLPNSLNIIGFKEFIPYFKEEKTLEQVKEDIVIHTRQYAKRQRTWFKRNSDVIFVKKVGDILKII